MYRQNAREKYWAIYFGVKFIADVSGKRMLSGVWSLEDVSNKNVLCALSAVSSTASASGPARATRVECGVWSVECLFFSSSLS